MTTTAQRRVFLAGTLLCLALGLFLLARFAPAEAEEAAQAGPSAEPRPVSLHTVSRMDESGSRTYPGAARAVQEADLAFRVAGPLTRVLVQAGDVVRTGDVLLAIDPRDFQDNVGVLEAQLAGAVAGRDNARRNLDRMTPLLAQQVVSQSDFDNARSAFDTAQAQVRSIQAQLDIARHRLEDTTLVAPFDGMVTSVAVDNFEMVAAGQTVVRMHDISRLEIDVDVPENEIGDMDIAADDMDGSAAFPSLEGRSFDVALKEWSAEADAATRTYTVTFVMENTAQPQVLPGMTAEVTLAPRTEGEGPLVVPAGAVSTDMAGESVVWVYDRSSATASPRTIRTGQIIGGDWAVVLDGLVPGEAIVSAGMDFITEGMLLRPMDTGRL